MSQEYLSIHDSTQVSMKYIGAVKIVYKNKKNEIIKITRHNTGYMPLFTAIARALAGLSVEYDRPSKIMGYYVDKSDPDNVRVNDAFIQPIANKSTPLVMDEYGSLNENSCNAIQYTFVIPASNILGTSNHVTKINRLCLLNNRNDYENDVGKANVCAQVDLDDKSISDNVASNILIYWTLKFVDASDTIVNN